MFTFLSPIFLVGMFAAAVPLVIHLSRSRRRKRMPFSTTRFFTDQFVRSYRMSRLKELLLLAARMALFAFFAAALARPILMPQGRSYLTGRRCVVFVMDNSASMGYADGGVALLARAKASALEVLEGLKEGDTAAIVLAGRQEGGAEVPFPEPTSELGDVRQVLEELDVAALGTDLTGAIDQAERIVREGKGPSREIYVLSDLQDSGWEFGDDDGSSAPDADLLYFFIHLRPERVQNVSLTAVQYANANPAVGIPFSVRPHVLNSGSDVVSVDVSLFVDGEKVGEKHVEGLQGGRWSVPRFHHTFASGGWHSGYVELAPAKATDRDGLAVDNRRYFAFEVLESVHVLAVNGSPSNVRAQDELFFLRAALTASAEGESPVMLEEVPPAQLEQTELEAFSVVLLANVESIPLGALEKLEAYVDGGGALLVFLGDKTNAKFCNQHLSSATRLHGGLLPASLAGIEGAPLRGPGAGGAGVGSVGGVDFDHPAMVAFEDPAFADLAGIEFGALWSVAPSPEAMVLMEAGTGYPLLCEKAFGTGRVLLFASTCDRDWTDFPVRPAYLPWIHRLVAYLAQEPLARSGFITTGQHVPIPVSASSGVQPVLIRQPDGTLGNPVATPNPDTPLMFTGTNQIGVYEIREPGKAAVRQAFVANLDAYESELTFLDDVLADGPSGSGQQESTARGARVEAGLKGLLPGRPLLNYVGEPHRLQEVSLRARRGVRLWDVFLVVVLVLALAEPWFANRISLRHYINPQANPEARGPSMRIFPLPGAVREARRESVEKEAGASR
jgi:hypothetical protein